MHKTFFINDDVSKAINRLKSLLLCSTCFSELLTIYGTSSRGTVNRWPLPELVTVEVAMTADERWPFTHLPICVLKSTPTMCRHRAIVRKRIAHMPSTFHEKTSPPS